MNMLSRYIYMSYCTHTLCVYHTYATISIHYMYRERIMTPLTNITAQIICLALIFSQLEGFFFFFFFFLFFYFEFFSWKPAFCTILYRLLWLLVLSLIILLCWSKTSEGLQEPELE